MPSKGETGRNGRPIYIEKMPSELDEDPPLTSYGQDREGQNTEYLSEDAAQYHQAGMQPMYQQQWIGKHHVKENGPWMDNVSFHQPLPQPYMQYGTAGGYATNSYPGSYAPGFGPAQQFGGQYYQGQCPQPGYPPYHGPYQTQNSFSCAPSGYSYLSQQQAPRQSSHPIPVKKVRFSQKVPKYRRGQVSLEDPPYEPPPTPLPRDQVYPAPEPAPSATSERPQPQSQNTTASNHYQYSTNSSGVKEAAMKPTRTRQATERDLKFHNIPTSYDSQHWDADERPITLLCSVFDTNSLGKWIYDCTVHEYEPSSPMSNLAGELWLQLIQLSAKIRISQEAIDPVLGITDLNVNDQDMFKDFLESGDRLLDRLQDSLRRCEEPMLETREEEDAPLDDRACEAFVKTLFGRDQYLEKTENLMQSIRLWILRWNANCEPVVHPHKHPREQEAGL